MFSRLQVSSLALVLLVSVSAQAQDPPTLHIPFEELAIEGGLPGPEGVNLVHRGEVHFGRLGELQRSFVAEIVRSAPL